MKQTSFTMKTALIATLILSGKSFAQSLPDEINHPVYLRTYQNLEQILNTKTAEYNSLAAQKVAIEKDIAQMESDLVALPQRTSQLEQIIATKNQELVKINSDIQGVESVLSQIIANLQQIDASLTALNSELTTEGQRNQAIQVARTQAAANAARINNALNAELQEENQSVRRLEVHTASLNNDILKLNEASKDRQDLIRSVDRFKRELPGSKKKLSDNTSAIASKKPQLTDAQGKLAPLKVSISQEEGKVVALDAEISPKATKLAELKAELNRVMPEVAKLEKENKDSNAKIDSNKAKITAAGLTALVAKKEALEKEITAIENQISTLSASIVALKEAIKPELAQQLKLRSEIRELERANTNASELQRLKAELASLETRLAPKRQEIARQEKQHEQASLNILPKKSELETVKVSVTAAETTVAGLTKENEELSAKIAANQVSIDQMTSANAPLMKEIKDLEAQIAALQGNREKAAKNVAELKNQEKALNTQITSLTQEIKNLENENLILTRDVAQMEKAINEFPIDNRRLENLMQKLDENIAGKRAQINTEEKLLARIRASRLNIERDLLAAQNELGLISTDLVASDNVIASIRQQMQSETANREALVRRNQDSVTRYDGLKAAKAAAEKVVADSNQEIGFNDQDLDTIAKQLPISKRDLSNINPKVATAEKAMSDAQKKASDANSQYQSRLSLYERYLSEARDVGSDRASIATADGQKAGSSEGKAKAVKLASENAAAQAKWEAIQRGYVRGEIAGYSTGFQTGLESTADAEAGNSQGRAAGQKRAKDHANNTLKPEFYLEELERRLVEDQVAGNAKAKLSNLSFADAVAMNMAASMRIEAAPSDVPELTQAEINQARSIVSSLDALIDQAGVESSEVLKIRNRLADPRQAYATPGAGVNAQNANCSGVYKNLKDFVDACKATYVARYPGLYTAAHAEFFASEYRQAFGSQIESVFDSEISRLYPNYLREGTSVGTTVGVSAGKAEIRQQAFSRAEADAYRTAIVTEEARVEVEAVALVQDHLKANSALTLKGEAKLSTKSEFGIAPGADVELKMVVKNIGAKASTGNSLVKITEASSNLVLGSRQAALGQVAANSQADLSVLALKVNDNAEPGSKVVIAGEIVHPGNHYRASRVENFRIESVLKVNPAIESEVAFTAAPNIATLGILKKHDIDFTVRPKHEGVSEGYEVSIEEVGSSLVKFSNSRTTTERLSRGQSKKVSFEYKLDKSSKGKTINLKVTVKNGGVTIKAQDLQIKPK